MATTWSLEPLTAHGDRRKVSEIGLPGLHLNTSVYLCPAALAATGEGDRGR